MPVTAYRAAASAARRSSVLADWIRPTSTANDTNPSSAVMQTNAQMSETPARRRRDARWWTAEGCAIELDIDAPTKGVDARAAFGRIGPMSDMHLAEANQPRYPAGWSVTVR